MEEIFQESKQVIIAEIQKGVRIFDMQKPTCLATDWSKNGIGFWLFQKHCDCPHTKPFCCREGWQITLVGSRFTHAAESRYAPIEGEALAVADALDKARFFVLGCSNLIIAVDHKPLLRVLGDRSLDAIANPRLRNLKEKTLRYRFRVVHVPGAKHRAADALSRHPSGSLSPPLLPLPDDVATLEDSTTFLSRLSLHQDFLAGIRVMDESTTDVDDEQMLKCYGAAALTPLQVVTWDDIRTATASDEHLNQLLTIIEHGMPENRHELPPPLREYHQFRDNLYTVDGVILYKDRIVIPQSQRQKVLSALHAAHQGITKMSTRAEASVFWPGITQTLWHYVLAAVTATAWRLLSPVPLPPHPYHLCTHFNAFVQISSTMQESTI